jgi:hypothetical protein
VQAAAVVHVPEPRVIVGHQGEHSFVVLALPDAYPVRYSICRWSRGRSSGRHCGCLLLGGLLRWLLLRRWLLRLLPRRLGLRLGCRAAGKDEQQEQY